MEEKNNKPVRKKIIKRIAIIFVVALIILTFFSNTIMNYSLPEVATVTVFSGTVSQKVRCQGQLEVSKDAELTVTGDRVVKEVKVESGDRVKKGDVIMTFDETENTELAEAESQLETLELDYQKSQIKEEKDYSEQEKAIVDARQALADAQAALAQAQVDLGGLDQLRASVAETSGTLEKKQGEVTVLETKVETYPEEEKTGKKYEKLVNKLAAAKAEVTGLETSLEAQKAEVTRLEEISIEELQNTVNEKQTEVDTAENNLTKEKKTAAVQAQTDAIDNQKSLKDIEEQKKKVEKLKKISDYKELKATGDGVITDIHAKEGEKVTAGNPIAVIQLDGSGYEVSCSVKKQEAEMLKVGNEADIENIWSDDVKAEIKSIKADPEDPNRQSIVKFKVEGDVQAGETLMFAVGEKNVKSDTVVPNSAVKEDSDGKFIWNIKVKATPLGNRYIAKKVKVDVSASDTSNSAIEGEVSGYENVVTNSSKPLDDGQQVRLTEN